MTNELDTFFNAPLAEVDAEIFGSITDELSRQRHEIELIAQIARYHRKSHPKAKHPEFASLTDPDQQRIRVLAGMLRVGIGLDRTYRRSVERVTVESTRKRLRLGLVTDADADVELEVFTARERSALLAEALGREIELEPVEEHS